MERDSFFFWIITEIFVVKTHVLKQWEKARCRYKVQKMLKKNIQVG